MGHLPHAFEALPHYFTSQDFILHYTCNSPNEEILKRKGIKAMGEDFGSDSKEVLKIPTSIYFKEGYFELKDKNVLKMNCEHLMVKLENDFKQKKGLGDLAT